MNVNLSDIKVTCVKEDYEPDCHEGFKQYSLFIGDKEITHAFTDSFHDGKGKVDDGQAPYKNMEAVSEKKQIEYAKKIMYLLEKKKLSTDGNVRQECDEKIKRFSSSIIASIVQSNKVDYSNTTPSYVPTKPQRQY